MSYKLQAKYPHSYKMLEDALEQYAIDCEMKGYKYQTDTDKWKYNAIAAELIEWINNTFSYISSEHERIIHFLQGLGLNIDYTYHDIYQLGYKEGRLLETDSENKHIKFANNYWNFMAMRLKNIAGSK